MKILYSSANFAPASSFSLSPFIVMGTKFLFIYSPHSGVGKTSFSIFLHGAQYVEWKLIRTYLFSSLAFSSASLRVMSKKMVPYSLVVSVVLSASFVVFGVLLQAQVAMRINRHRHKLPANDFVIFILCLCLMFPL